MRCWRATTRSGLPRSATADGATGAKATVLTSEVLDTLRERVKRPPDDGGVWSSRKVAAVMAAELGLGSVAEQRGEGRRVPRDRLDDPEAATAPTPARRRPRSKGRSKRAPRDRRRGGRAPSRRGDRDRSHRRAPRRSRPIAGRHRPQADPSPGLGAAWRAPHGRRTPPLRMALRHRLRLARHRRERLVPLDRRPSHARLRGRARALRARGPAPGAAASSCSCSTTPAGTARPGSPSPRASASSTCRPTPPSSSRPRRCGPTSTSRSPTGTSTPSACLDAAVAGQCVALSADRDRIKGQAGFHWWPARVVPN